MQTLNERLEQLIEAKRVLERRDEGSIEAALTAILDQMIDDLEGKVSLSDAYRSARTSAQSDS